MRRKFNDLSPKHWVKRKAGVVVAGILRVLDALMKCFRRSSSMRKSWDGNAIVGGTAGSNKGNTKEKVGAQCNVDRHEILSTQV